MLTFENPANPTPFRDNNPLQMTDAADGFKLVTAYSEFYPEPLQVAPTLAVNGLVAMLHINSERWLRPNDLPAILTELGQFAALLEQLPRRHKPNLVMGATHKSMELLARRLGFESHVLNDQQVVGPEYQARMTMAIIKMRKSEIRVAENDTTIYAVTMPTDLFIATFAGWLRGQRTASD